jgi:hypothetical protein
MANTKRYSTLNLLGAGLFVWFVLHWIPLPCPIGSAMKDLLPPEYYDSLGFFDPPWGFAQPLLGTIISPSSIRQIGWVLLFYEPLLLALTLAILYRFPHWLIGRD